MTPEFLKTIITAVGGGTLGVILTWWLNVRKDKRNDYLTIIETYRDEFERQHERILQLESEIKNYEAELITMRTEIDELRSILQKKNK